MNDKFCRKIKARRNDSLARLNRRKFIASRLKFAKASCTENRATNSAACQKICVRRIDNRVYLQRRYIRIQKL